MELSERKKKILKSIVDAYISSGEPVGSKYLSGQTGLAVSSATIRNEMSDLEELGLLEQPHTSAGRVPSTLGYRTYIENLMEEYKLCAEEINLLNELLTFKVGEINKVMERASKVISSLTNYTTISVLKSGSARIKRFEAMLMDGNGIILAMICSDDSVKSKTAMFSPDEKTVTQDDLSKLVSALNANLSGLSAEEITLSVILKTEEAMGERRSLVSPVLRMINEMLTDGEGEEISVAGIPKLLSYPEFYDVDKARRALTLFEAKNSLVSTVMSASPDQTHVIMSDDGNDLDIPGSSFVFRPIAVNGKTIGAVGVIGPKRMDYKKVIANIEYLVQGMDDIIDGT